MLKLREDRPVLDGDEARKLRAIRDALIGEHAELEAAHLRPVNLLADFLKELRRPEVIALTAGDDPESYRSLLSEVEQMQQRLSVLSA